MNNGGLISTDCAGCSWLYPNSTYSERKTIHKQHVDYQQVLLHEHELLCCHSNREPTRVHFLAT